MKKIIVFLGLVLITGALFAQGTNTYRYPFYFGMQAPGTVTGGRLFLNGITSGSVELKVAAAAGTGTVFQFPPNNGTSGYLLRTDGSGITTWIASPTTFPGFGVTHVLSAYGDHAHGNITTDGKIGTTTDLPVVTGAGGVVTVGTVTTLGSVAFLRSDTVDNNEPATNYDVSLKANISSPTFTNTPAAPTAAAGTNTTQVATTAFVQTASTKDYISMINALGASVLVWPPSLTIYGYSQFTLLNNVLYVEAVYISTTMTITGVKFSLSTAGDYTANSHNHVGLYSYSGGNITLVAKSTDDGDLWKATANTLATKAFSATYSAAPGVYYIGIEYRNSAETTAPKLHSGYNTITTYSTVFGLANSAVIAGSRAAQADMANQAMSDLTGISANLGLFLY